MGSPSCASARAPVGVEASEAVRIIQLGVTSCSTGPRRGAAVLGPATEATEALQSAGSSPTAASSGESSVSLAPPSLFARKLSVCSSPPRAVGGRATGPAAATCRRRRQAAAASHTGWSSTRRANGSRHVEAGRAAHTASRWSALAAVRINGVTLAAGVGHQDTVDERRQVARELAAPTFRVVARPATRRHEEALHHLEAQHSHGLLGRRLAGGAGTCAGHEGDGRASQHAQSPLVRQK
eukprot:scaffold252020_cov28-Tisochrysis_lutea.AAC.5